MFDTRFRCICRNVSFASPLLRGYNVDFLLQLQFLIRFHNVAQSRSKINDFEKSSGITDSLDVAPSDYNSFGSIAIDSSSLLLMKVVKSGPIHRLRLKTRFSSDGIFVFCSKNAVNLLQLLLKYIRR